MFSRTLQLPAAGSETFFLWGPRQTGKTTLLRAQYPDALWLDLLQADVFRRYLEQPARLRQELSARPEVRFAVIDEVQKVPDLLDEVHWMHEHRGLCFALCGSSARKVKAGRANLLGGRAIRYELHGLSAFELGDDFELERMLNHGYLPRHYESDRPLRLLSAYVADYLKEEVIAEGLVRKLPVFSAFLDIAALSDTEPVNFATIARDCGVSAPTIKGHFGILVDTLQGRWLPLYRRRPKRRVAGAPKFYFADVGVVSFLAKRGPVVPGSELFGKAFESWVFHELCAYNAYRERFATLSYWRLASGLEVDFIVDNLKVAIEAKGSARITSDHLRGLHELRTDHPEARRRVVVCLEPAPRRTEDGIEILPYQRFIDLLWQGELF
jgi:predicted AAA+ superfamily ATPase